MSDSNIAALETLLKALDSDNGVAGEKYEHIRRALMRFFRSRQCPIAEELTDETFNRVGRRLLEGAELRGAEITSFFLGVARHVIQEYWKKPNRSAGTVEELPPSRQPSVDPLELERIQEEVDEKDTRMHCLENCMQRLFPDSQEQIVEYYLGEKRTKIDNRQKMAERLGIPLNVLRIRMCRMRGKLQDCIHDCLAASAV
jgi:DNA-directed RNA polymerase specialized sigma24 family protein